MTVDSARMPMIVLAGSDRRMARLPAAGRDKHPLHGYKGVDVRIGGRPLVEIVVERLAACGAFEAVYVAGPERVYAGVVPRATLIDTDEGFGGNIRTALERVVALHPGRCVAFTVCDILPEVVPLRGLMARHADGAPHDLWFPLVHAPEDPQDLGASAWKPAYRIVPAAGAAPVRVLPGHLVVVDPSALRLAFLYRLFDLGYHTRNRPIHQRRRVMVRGVMAALLYQDLRQLLRGKAPTLTASVVLTGITAAGQLRSGTITLDSLEHALRRIFVSRQHRRRHPGRRVRLPIVDALFLARDIDTLEEAAELGGEVCSHPA
jgi:hypothetical protein